MSYRKRGSSPRLVDRADLLSELEEEELEARLDEISERQQADVVVVTVNSLDGRVCTGLCR